MKGKDLLFPVPPENDEFNPTASEGSSSSHENIFRMNQPMVMVLHGVEKDELPDNPLPEVKTRKLLKKKRPKPEQEQSAVSMTSSSDSSMVPPGPEKQEEFYDAHETYYDFPENQISSQALRDLAVVSSHQNSPDVRQAPETTALTGAATVATQNTAMSQTPKTSAATKQQKRDKSGVKGAPQTTTDATSTTAVTQNTTTSQTPISSAVTKLQKRDKSGVKGAPQTTTDATSTTAVTQNTTTSQTPISSAVIKPIHPQNPE